MITAPPPLPLPPSKDTKHSFASISFKYEKEHCSTNDEMQLSDQDWISIELLRNLILKTILILKEYCLLFLSVKC